ncbi:hypothetical protein MHYP_G00267280 [Metynnis hypsauchen]
MVADETMRHNKKQRHGVPEDPCCSLSVLITATTEASLTEKIQQQTLGTLPLSIFFCPPPPITGCGPARPGFSLSGYLPVKASGVRMGRARPDLGSPEPALASALDPLRSVNGRPDECGCLCADSRDEFVCLREEQEGLNTLPPRRTS